MFYQIFLSPQVKRWAIITYEHGLYMLAEISSNVKISLASQKGNECYARKI